MPNPVLTEMKYVFKMICEVKDVHELTQAGIQNNHKTTADMQRVNLLLYFAQQGDPKAMPGQS